jgi:hypothetical protein
VPSFRRNYDLESATEGNDVEGNHEEIEEEDDEYQKITPELIAKATGASQVLMPSSYFLRERLDNLISMLENQLFQSAALDLRNHQEHALEFVRGQSINNHQAMESEV